MHKPESVQENETHKILWDFMIETDQSSLTRRFDLELICKKKKKKKKRICHLVVFAVPVDHRMKMKVSEKIDEYLDLARKLKKLWNMKVIVISITVGALGTVPKGLKK